LGTLVIGLELVRLPAHSRARLRLALLQLVALTAALTTVKLSGLLLFPLLAVVALVVFVRDKIRWPWLFVLPCLLAVGMLARRAMLSGWLLYPVPVGNLHLTWSAPKEVPLVETLYIRAW